MRMLLLTLVAALYACGPSAEQTRLSREQHDATLITGTIDSFETSYDSMNWPMARSALSANVDNGTDSVSADELIAQLSDLLTEGKTRSRNTTQNSVTIDGDTATVIRTGTLRYEIPALTEIEPNFWQGTGQFEYALTREGDTWLLTKTSFVPTLEEGDRRVVTHSPQQLQNAVFVSGLTGTWRGTYCGNSSTTWSINTAEPESSWATERWCNGFTCGDLDFQLSGADSARRSVTALAHYGTGFSVTGFTIDFTVSADGTRLDGAFNGHPRCESIHMTRTSTSVSAEPLSAQTASSIYTAAAQRPQRSGGSYSNTFDSDGYRAALEHDRAVQYGQDVRQQQQQWDGH